MPDADDELAAGAVVLHVVVDAVLLQQSEAEGSVGCGQHAAAAASFPTRPLVQAVIMTAQPRWVGWQRTQDRSWDRRGWRHVRG